MPLKQGTVRSRSIVVLVASALVAAVVGLIALGGRDGPAASSPVSASGHPVAVPAVARTVLVSRSMPLPSAHVRRLSAMLEQGAMPVRPVTAEVLTDTDCTPDAWMISRCRNVVRLASGRELVLRHPHDMSRIPCLAPGERIRLVPTEVS